MLYDWEMGRWILVGLLAACESPSEAPSDARAPGEPRCMPSRFDPGLKWPIPFGAPWLTNSDHVGKDWGLRDLDGDHRRDLVVTYDVESLPVGTTRWTFYKNLGTGFADPTAWLTPISADKLTGGQNGRSWELMDMDGDGRPELVLLTLAGDSRLGLTRWNVYWNVGTRFQQKPAVWSLPFASPTFDDQNNDAHDHVLFDIDGDALPDLVVTKDVDAGLTGWQVYRNTSVGFATPPVTWALPFEAPQVTEVDGVGVDHAMVDLDGDHRPELVVLRDGADPAVGLDHWRVFHNTGNGFADGTDWPIPFAATTFEDRDLVGRDFSTFDLDADGLPDLVVPLDATDPDAGQTRWNIMHNTGTGFAPIPSYWTIQFPTNQFTESDDQGKDWSTFDLDGDGFRDLVLPLHDTDVMIGSSYWLWYPSSCL